MKSQTENLSIESVRNEPALDTIRTLVRKYADELAEQDWICGENLEQELKNLPGKFSEPDGAIVLARINDQPIGCALLEPYDGDTVEMKRLFVRSQYRGNGYGRQICEQVIELARDLGYDRFHLVTTKQMTEAQTLYRSLGLEETDPFHDYGDHFIYMTKSL